MWKQGSEASETVGVEEDGANQSLFLYVLWLLGLSDSLSPFTLLPFFFVPETFDIYNKILKM